MTVSPGQQLDTLSWQFSQFDDLSARDTYAALQLRQMVFIVEQTCPYLDADGLDADAWHLFGWLPRADEPLLAAYVRILPPGVKYAEASIGRVVTHPEVRGTGLGKQLMREAIRRTEMLAPGAAIRIGAQCYLERFYAELGFWVASEPYDEDGIPHIQMLRVPG